MENLNNVKLCYTKKATILPHLISILICGIICLILIPLPILPYLPFVEVSKSNVKNKKNKNNLDLLTSTKGR